VGVFLPSWDPDPLVAVPLDLWESLVATDTGLEDANDEVVGLRDRLEDADHLVVGYTASNFAKAPFLLFFDFFLLLLMSLPELESMVAGLREGVDEVVAFVRA
jgi:hypothetical protein